MPQEAIAPANHPKRSSAAWGFADAAGQHQQAAAFGRARRAAGVEVDAADPPRHGRCSRSAPAGPGRRIAARAPPIHREHVAQGLAQRAADRGVPQRRRAPRAHQGMVLLRGDGALKSLTDETR
jgi:hypothetical protein